MSHLYPFCKDIELYVEGRVPQEDARRQALTAREILKRLKEQPGIILADEVGMGKTFVALAVAVSVALANRHRRPVVVMVPPSLRRKWPDDFKLFLSKCVPANVAQQLRFGEAHRAEELLKLLDDPPQRRRSIIFATHGCMGRGLSDKWVKLALIRQALWHRHNIDGLRSGLCKILGHLLHLRWVDHQHGQEIWEELLDKHPSRWLDVLRRWGIDPEEDDNPCNDDDPVPGAVCDVLSRLPTDALFEKLKEIPLRQSDSFDARLKEARQAISQELRSLWPVCIKSLKLRLPLLILDEAHHLKNPDTQLASLFRCEDAQGDVEEICRGELAGVFERMLFLTATPFQLGHGELCSVLDRFGGIAWNGRLAPRCGQEGFNNQIGDLRSALDAAQDSAIRLDEAWGKLRKEDVSVDGQPTPIDSWWQQVVDTNQTAVTVRLAVECYHEASRRLKTAEGLLQPWVIRHLKPRYLPSCGIPRRQRLPGSAICDETAAGEQGIALRGDSLLPFLLAARASCCAPDSRPVFAEGLASSYEAFLYTRRQGGCRGMIDGDDDEGNGSSTSDAASRWYLDQLERLLPKEDVESSTSHPKVLATVQRCVDAWRQGEKVLVFCHFIATGRVLRQCISHAIDQEIRRMGCEKLECNPAEVAAELDKLGDRFFDPDAPIRKAYDAEVGKLLDAYPSLVDYHPQLLDLVRRNVRTPSFLVRFFSFEGKSLKSEAMHQAMDKPDQSGMTLRRLVQDFLEFLDVRCDENGRQRFIEAISRVQTGSHVGKDVQKSYSPDELQGYAADKLIPNVRLVNGTTRQDTRQRLMLAFNTPFYPEVLVASSVMAEGVDLQLNCRFVIHHDLCWNPSTLEQRTGRIDRVGAKAERCRRSIQVYLPYIGETQDEKMYRVVMDRERWFSVVMGEKFSVDVRTTEAIAARMPFPEAAAAGLAFRLDVPSLSSPVCASTSPAV